MVNKYKTKGELIMNGFKLESVGENLKELKITLEDKLITVKMFVESEESFRILEVSSSEINDSYTEFLKREIERLKINNEKKQVTTTVVNVDCDKYKWDKINADDLSKVIIKRLL